MDHSIGELLQLEILYADILKVLELGEEFSIQFSGKEPEEYTDSDRKLANQLLLYMFDSLSLRTEDFMLFVREEMKMIMSAYPGLVR